MKLTFRCQECSQKLNVGHNQIGSVVTCPACGAVQSVPAPLAKRYRVLRFTASVLQVVSILVTVLLLTFILLAQYWSEGHSLGDTILLLGLGIPASLLAGLLIYALAEGIGLIVDVEEHLRATRRLLELQRSEQKSTVTPPPS